MDWQSLYASKLMNAQEAVSKIKRGSRVFIGTGCGEPQHLIKAMVTDQKLQDQVDDRSSDAHGSGRDRPVRRAGNPRIEVAIDDVVVGAAGAAHDDGADREQGDERRAWQSRRGECDTPPAGKKKKPCADGAIEA